MPMAELARGGDAVQGAQLDRGGDGAGGVVLVRVRRAEDRVQARALVAEHELQQVAAVVGEHALRAARECVQPCGGPVVLVEVDAAEAQEEWHRRSELREELAAPRPHALVHGRQQPGPDEILGQRVDLVDGVLLERGPQPGDDGDLPPGAGIAPPLAEHDRVAEGLERRLVEHHLAAPRVLLGGRQLVDQAPGQHVEQLQLGIADDEAAGRADRDGDLHRQAHLVAAGRRHRPDLGHHLLHGEAAGHGARPVVTVEPAGDGVAAEVDDLAAERVQAIDHGVEHAVEAGRQLLRPALGPELGRQRRRERREAGDVGEERGAVHAVRQLEPGGQRTPAITRDVGVGDVPAGRHGAPTGIGGHPPRMVTAAPTGGKAWRVVRIPAPAVAAHRLYNSDVASTAGTQRIVSVAVADVVGSTAIGERLGPARSKFLFDEVIALMALGGAALRRHRRAADGRRPAGGVRRAARPRGRRGARRARGARDPVGDRHLRRRGARRATTSSWRCAWPSTAARSC